MKKKVPSLVGIIFIIGCAFLIGSIIWQYDLFLEVDYEQFIAGKKPASECEDHIDNDGDGYCDYAWRKAYCNDGSIVGDAGCRSKKDNSETNCGDGVCEGGEKYANCSADCPCISFSETCNNVDDDCNGLIDDNLSQQCGITDTGPCEYGTQTCSAGSWGNCFGSINPSAEVCDNFDNNCNGQIDDNLFQQCGITDVGPCRYGTRTCSAGSWGNCLGSINPTTEICDNFDNNCNGQIDDNLFQQCGITDVGPCKYGTRTCSTGSWGGCLGSINPTTEICDGIDNNCNGEIDEDCISDEPSTAVTIQQLKDDITLPHEMSPLPVIPDYWGWSYNGWPYQENCGPRSFPDDGRNYYNPWGQIFPDPSTPNNLNAGFELGPITFYVKLKSTGEWHTYEHGTVNGGYIFYGQSALPEVPGTSWNPISGPGGGLFYKLGMGNWQQNQGAHWWPSHSHEWIDNPDVEHVAASITARIVLQDPDGVDDRDQAKYLIGIGVDHRIGSGEDGPIIQGVLMSRHRYLTNEWQTFTVHDMCPEMLQVEQPPIHGLVTEPCTSKTCAELGKECGAQNDTCGGTINCGSCDGELSCVVGQCVEACTPKSCAELGKECGAQNNGCGGTVNCGGCGQGFSCVVGQCEEAPADITFAVIGDFGTGYSNSGQVASRVKSWNPDFIITTGDNNYQNGSASTIDKNIGQFYSDYIYPYYGSYGSTATENAFFPTLGNHDWVATNAQPHLDYFTLPGNERYYDFVKGPVHFFAIDSDTKEPDGATSSSVQGQWLKNGLAASTSPFKLVYFHETPYGSSKGINERMEWPFKQWGADIVIAGHDHIYERFLIDGFPYIVNGLGGAIIYDFNYNLPGSQFRYNDDLGAMLVEATNESMVLKFFKHSGELIDSYTIESGSGGEPEPKPEPEPEPEPGIAVTFQQLRDDITLPHEMSPLPVIPSSWGWSYQGFPYQDDCGSRNFSDNGKDYYNPWGQIFPDPNTPNNLNAGFELGPITFYIKLKSTGQWYTYEHGVVNDGYIFYGQSALPEVPGSSWNPISGPGGGLFYKLGMGGWGQDQGAHFWPSHSHEWIDNPDVEHVAVSITGRIVLQNPNGVDDRNQAKYLVGIGVDHRAQSGEGSIIEATLMSRHRYLTNEWQTFTAHTMCAGSVEIDPPPIHGAVW